MTKTIRNSKILEINQPYLYALIRKAFFIFGHFWNFRKIDFFSWFSKMSNFGSKILPEGAFACIKILSFIKKNFFLASD